MKNLRRAVVMMIAFHWNVFVASAVADLHPSEISVSGNGPAIEGSPAPGETLPFSVDQSTFPARHDDVENEVTEGQAPPRAGRGAPEGSR